MLIGGGGVGTSHPPICLKLQEFWSKADHAACTLATVFFRDLGGQIVKTPPPNRKYLGTPLGVSTTDANNFFNKSSKISYHTKVKYRLL